MNQRELPLLQAIDGPVAVPSHIVSSAKTYREAVRLCWAIRRAKGLRAADLGRDHGFTRQHVSDYLNADDKPSRRDLPAAMVDQFEEVCGNRLISQWLARQSGLTVLEEVQANHREAA